MSDESPSTATILKNVEQLTNIEQDLADTAVAVASAPAPTDDPIAQEAAAAGPDPIIQNAEAVESVLEQSIPDAPSVVAAVPNEDVSVAAPEEVSMPAAIEEPVQDVNAESLSAPDAVVAQPTLNTDADLAFTEAPQPVQSAISEAPAQATDGTVPGNSDEIVVEQDDSEPMRLEDDTVDEQPTTLPIEANQAETNVNGNENGPSDPMPLPLPATTQQLYSVPPSSSQPTESSIGFPAKIEPSDLISQDLPFPEGISASSPSVISNPDIIQDWQRYPTNPQILLALFDWSIQRGEVVDARAWHNALSIENPTASQPLLDLINLESTLTNFPAVEALFARALKGPSGGITASADVNIWKAYLHYIRRQNPVGTGAADEEAKRRVITDAYEFALKQCGVDRDAGEIWGEYIAFVQDVKAKNTWETQAQQDTLRKIYQRAVCIPLNNVEVLWKGYDAFESSVNKQTSKKFLAERSPAYMTARTALRELRNLTDVLPHPVLPPTPTFSDNDRQVVSSWKAYLKWEEGNPLVIPEPEVLAGRVGYAMRRCVAEMRHFPEMCAQYYLKEAKLDEAAEVLKAGVEACPKSVLLTFATAEIEEDRKNFSEAHTLFTNLTDQLGQDIDKLVEIIDKEIIIAKGPEIPRPQGEAMDVDGEGPEANYNRMMDEREERGKMVEERRGKEVMELRTAMGVVWIMYMRFARRAEGLKAARAIFGKARKSPHITWHSFEAAALMEYHVNKDSAVAIRIFELGFKLFSEDVDYVVRYLQFLLNINDDTNARALFERSTLKIPSDKSRPLWDTWAKYEYMYGDLGAVQKLESRFSETFPADSPLKRFAQRYTYNGIDQIARRDLGFGAPGAQRQAPPATQPPFPPSNPIPMPTQGMHQLPPPPPAQNTSPINNNNNMAKRPHSPPRPNRSVERSNSPSGVKRFRPNSPPPPPRRYDQAPAPMSQPVLPPPRDGGRGYGPPPPVRGRSPLPQSSGIPPYSNGGPPAPGYASQAPPRANLPPVPQAMGPPGGYVPPPREGWDRSGVSRGLAWFVGQLPNARSFDGPVFRPDDIMGLFANIGPDGLRLPAAPAPYGGPAGGGYAEPQRGYGGAPPPPRRY